MQRFTQADATTGDILMVQKSLGGSAAHLRVEADGDLEFSLNVIRTVSPMRQNDPFFASNCVPNVALTVELIDSTPSVVLVSGETYSMDEVAPIDDIQLIVASGNFSILVS
jgi:hypothetical protein